MMEASSSYDTDTQNRDNEGDNSKIINLVENDLID